MSDREPQSEAELAAHFGPDGPVAAAEDWLRAVLIDGDYAEAWASMTDDLRLGRAQAWLWNNRDLFRKAAETLDEQASMLAACPSEHAYWDEFAEIEVGTFREAIPPERWDDAGRASRPRPIGPDLELVLFPYLDKLAEKGAQQDGDRGLIVSGASGGVLTEMWAQIVVSHKTGHWLVAGHNGETLPTLGWPPSF